MFLLPTETLLFATKEQELLQKFQVSLFLTELCLVGDTWCVPLAVKSCGDFE